MIICYYFATAPGGEAGCDISQIPCRVCSGPSSGFHFGALTCEGCKGFFRRTVLSNVRLECLGNNDCPITPANRNMCKSCRFQRCLAVGMSKTGSRIGRQPNAIKYYCAREISHWSSSKRFISNDPDHLDLVSTTTTTIISTTGMCLISSTVPLTTTSIVNHFIERNNNYNELLQGGHSSRNGSLFSSSPSSSTSPLSGIKNHIKYKTYKRKQYPNDPKSHLHQPLQLPPTNNQHHHSQPSLSQNNCCSNNNGSISSSTTPNNVILHSGRDSILPSSTSNGTSAGDYRSIDPSTNIVKRQENIYNVIGSISNDSEIDSSTTSISTSRYHKLTGSGKIHNMSMDNFSLLGQSRHLLHQINLPNDIDRNNNGITVNSSDNNNKNNSDDRTTALQQLQFKNYPLMNNRPSGLAETPSKVPHTSAEITTTPISQSSYLRPTQLDSYIKSNRSLPNEQTNIPLMSSNANNNHHGNNCLEQNPSGFLNGGVGGRNVFDFTTFTETEPTSTTTPWFAAAAAAVAVVMAASSSSTNSALLDPYTVSSNLNECFGINDNSNNNNNSGINQQRFKLGSHETTLDHGRSFLPNSNIISYDATRVNSITDHINENMLKIGKCEPSDPALRSLHLTGPSSSSSNVTHPSTIAAMQAAAVAAAAAATAAGLVLSNSRVRGLSDDIYPNLSRVSMSNALPELPNTNYASSTSSPSPPIIVSLYASVIVDTSITVQQFAERIQVAAKYMLSERKNIRSNLPEPNRLFTASDSVEEIWNHMMKRFETHSRFIVQFVKYIPGK
ncbi:Nuclear receptor ROR-gamma [Schistosoma japonicum]|nr:Nuclear receptor ROR-gamma [Schistosoma japonicum]